jgi:hypothetical protein
MASIFTDIKNGERFTTEAERARILASDRCPTTETVVPPSPPGPTGSTGENVWGVSFYSTTGTTQNGVFTYASALDANENIYIAGSYNNDKFTVNSYSSTSSGTKVITQTTFGLLPTTATSASFITKYNSSGVAQWATSITATTSSACYNIVADSNGNVYSLHQFTGTATINSYTSRVDGGDITLTAYGTVAATNSDVLIVKHNSSGIVQWVAHITGASTEVIQRQTNIAIDSNTNLCFTIEGGTAGPINLTTFKNFSSGGGGGSITFSTFGTYSGKSRGIYICKLNSSGLFQWVSEVRPIAASFGLANSSCGVDSNNNVYIAFNCFTSGSSDGFDLQSYNGLSGTTILTTKWAQVATLLGTRDGFVAKLNSNGVFQECARFGSASRQVYETVCICIDSNNNVIATFRYSSDVSYNDESKINIYSAGGKDLSDNVVFTAWASLPVRAIYSTGSGGDAAILIFNSSLVAQRATYLYNADIVSPARRTTIRSVDRDGNNNIYVNVEFNGATLTINSFDSQGAGGLDNNINVTTFATLANTGSATSDCALIKFNSSLTTVWATRINDVNTNETTIPFSISVDKTSGSVYTAGYFEARSTGGIRFQNYTEVSAGAVSLTLGGQINSVATSNTSVRQGYLAKY